MSRSSLGAVATALFGIATLLLGIVMLFVFPSSAELTEGFRTPIIAFEFAQSPADVAFLSGVDTTATANRAKMIAGHRWDTLFPFAYAGFIACMLLQLGAQGQRWLWIAVPVALLIIPLDLRENAILVAITRALEQDEAIESLLAQLHIATWLKWGGLGLSLLALACGFMVARAYMAAAVSMIAGLSIAVCWASAAAPPVAEAMSALTALCFMYLAARAIVRALRLRHPKASPMSESTAMFTTTEELLAGFATIKRSPHDEGVVEKIVCRPTFDARRELQEAQLDTEVGLVGDNWLARGVYSPPGDLSHRDMQLNLMNARAIALIARSDERWQLAGDQFYIDMDLSPQNLPPGTQLQIGDAVIEVTAEPHTGCSKFVARFGRDAAVFVNSELGRSVNMRGINARVIRPGRVRVGSSIQKLDKA